MASSLPVLSSAGQIPVKLNKELVPVEEWGYQVWVWELTAGQQDAYRAPMFQWDEASGKMKPNLDGQNTRLVVHAVHDENGHLLYPDVEAGIQAVGELGAAGVAVVAKVAQRLSRMNDDASKKSEGNSEAGLTGASPSD